MKNQVIILCYLCFILVKSQIIHEEIPKRLFVKPQEPITLDVFFDEDYILYMEDLQKNTHYSVTLSYPGVYPVQYSVFLEKEDEDEYLSYDYKRRIQDTRIFSFETDVNGDIVEKEENGNIIHYLPILHIQPHHVMETPEPERLQDRYVVIVIEPNVFGITPTILSEIRVILVVLSIVLFLIYLYYRNDSYQQKDD